MFHQASKIVLENLIYKDMEGKWDWNGCEYLDINGKIIFSSISQEMTKNQNFVIVSFKGYIKVSIILLMI